MHDLCAIAGSRLPVRVPFIQFETAKEASQKKSQRGKLSPARSCLLRISIGADVQLAAEFLSGFREWLVERAPELGKSPRYLPDDGGLNIEGLAWSPSEQALLFGVRTPVIDHRPLILRVRLKRIDGPWDLSNFEMLSPIALATRTDRGELGIRSIEFDQSRGVVLIVVGNSTSKSKAPFALYSWDGNREGRVQHFPGVQFHKRMKVEGVTAGQVAGRGAIVFHRHLIEIASTDDPRAPLCVCWPAGAVHKPPLDQAIKPANLKKSRIVTIMSPCVGSPPGCGSLTPLLGSQLVACLR